MGGARPVASPLGDLQDTVGAAPYDRFDRTVAAIAHPAAHSKLPRPRCKAGAVADTLDRAANDQMPSQWLIHTGSPVSVFAA